MSAITALIDPRCEALGLTVEPPKETDGLHWELYALWLTENGNWDDVPEVFKDVQNDHLGGDHHVYMLGYRLDHHRAEGGDLFLLGCPDGHHKFSPKTEHDWWGNAAINAGFNWQEVSGPYYAQMNAVNSSVVKGIGLPYPPYPWQTTSVITGHRHYWDGETMVGDRVANNIQGGLHTSFFLVFQEVKGYAPEPETDQFQRVLDEAEKIANLLAGGQMEAKVAAAKIYLGIAELLSWR